MKKIIKCLMLFVTLLFTGACSCDKPDFDLFKESLNKIEGYRYFAVSQEIYNEELLLHSNIKSIYVDGDKYRIEIDEKTINDIEDENMYTETETEYFQQGTTFYYKENGFWKTKNAEALETSSGYSVSEDIFSSYQIKEENGNKILSGSIKNDSVNTLFGFDVSDVNELKMTVTINSNNKVKDVVLEYKADNNNKVVVSIEVGYSQVIVFELPTVE